MIETDILFSGIDYSATIENIAPRIVGHLGDAQSENPFRRFLGRMGDQSSMLLIESMNRLPYEHQERTLMRIMQCFDAAIAKQINASLQQYELTRDIAVNGFDVGEDAQTGKSVLRLCGLSVAYDKMLRNPTIREMAGAALPAYDDAIRDKAEALLGRLEETTSIEMTTLKSAAKRFSLSRLKDHVKGAADNNLVSLGAKLLHNPIDRRCVQILEMEKCKRAVIERTEAALKAFGIAEILAKSAVSISEQWVENMIINAVSKARNQNKLLNYINALLNGVGICATITGIRGVQGSGGFSEDRDDADAVMLTKEQQLMLVDAFTDYLHGELLAASECG